MFRGGGGAGELAFRCSGAGRLDAPRAISELASSASRYPVAELPRAACHSRMARRVPAPNRPSGLPGLKPAAVRPAWMRRRADLSRRSSASVACVEGPLSPRASVARVGALLSPRVLGPGGDRHPRHIAGWTHRSVAVCLRLTQEIARRIASGALTSRRTRPRQEQRNPYGHDCKKADRSRDQDAAAAEGPAESTNTSGINSSVRRMARLVIGFIAYPAVTSSVISLRLAREVLACSATRVLADHIRVHQLVVPALILLVEEDPQKPQPENEAGYPFSDPLSDEHREEPCDTPVLLDDPKAQQVFCPVSCLRWQTA